MLEVTLRIAYESDSFPPCYGFSSGLLSTLWDELLWAAITVGRPRTFHVFQDGKPSLHEAVFRLSLIRMAVEESNSGRLGRTQAFKALDPTEKGMVSYFLGMTLCKLFASRLLQVPWLLHLDVFRPRLNPALLGRSRPDLIGEDDTGKWYAFESKGRSAAPSWRDKTKAKSQACRLVSVNGTRCTLHVGSFAFFKADELQFYWMDPEPDSLEPITLEFSGQEWRHYYESALQLASDASAREAADVCVEIHPDIHPVLREERWQRARDIAKERREAFLSEGYQPDGLKVIAGSSWHERLIR